CRAQLPRGQLPSQQRRRRWGRGAVRHVTHFRRALGRPGPEVRPAPAGSGGCGFRFRPPRRRWRPVKSGPSRSGAGAVMPRYYEDKPEGGACAGLKEDLGACLLQSDCVLQEGKSPRQCLKEGNCKALKYSFFECKRSVVSS
ncbi:hypothetical protein EI555_011396, partial [Monodon monoceros]